MRVCRGRGVLACGHDRKCTQAQRAAPGSLCLQPEEIGRVRRLFECPSHCRYRNWRSLGLPLGPWPLHYNPHDQHQEKDRQECDQGVQERFRYTPPSADMCKAPVGSDVRARVTTDTTIASRRLPLNIRPPKHRCSHHWPGRHGCPRSVRPVPACRRLARN